ncbi:MAG: hypothetical protein AAF959_05240 [Cyanobacteria bacterium P01_D01_bin.56]
MQALETAIVDRISNSSDLPVQVAVLPWSDKPLKVSVPSGNTAAILVRFAGVQLQVSATPNRGRLVQSGQLEVETRFFVKTLREGNGAYDLMFFVQRVLSNFLPTALELNYSANLPGLQLVDCQLIGNDKTIWDWGQTYTLPITYTQRSLN